MDIQKLRELRNATPFHSFKVKLSDGREFTVIEPYYIGFSPTNDLVLVSAPQGTVWFSPLQVADVLNTNGDEQR